MYILIDLFERVGLQMNTKKTEAMTFIPGKILTRLSEEAYKLSRKVSHTQQEWKHRRVECDKCGITLNATSLSNHLEKQHGINQVRNIEISLLEERPDVIYQVCESRTGIFFLPVPGCVGQDSTKWILH